MANEELARAAAELDSFASLMAPSTTPASTPPPSQASTEMPTDTTGKRVVTDDSTQEGDRAKWHRGQGKGSQQVQRPKGKPQQQQSWWDKDHKGYAKSNDDLKQVVKALGRSVLRQEDSLSVMQLDCQFIIFMRNPVQTADSSQTPDWSVTKQLLSVGNHWRDRKAKDPKSLGQPLRRCFSAPG